MHCFAVSTLRAISLLAFLVPPLLAQGSDEPASRPPPEIPDFSNLDELLYVPMNTVSIGVRYLGRATATFGNLGTIATQHEATDLTSEVSRTYDNGYVGLDSRRDDDGNDIADDGRTNTWNMLNQSQITADESSIAFNTYSSTSEGATAAAETKPSAGVDVEFTREWGRLGQTRADGKRPLSWGTLWGFGLNDVNAKTRATITGTLHTLTDTYSLLGSAPPTLEGIDADADGTIDLDGNGNPVTNGYTSPSSITETLTNADGTTTSYTIDTSILLANRPDTRTETTEPGAAEIDGFWQVKGAYLTLRAGPWLRWQPLEYFALRISGGATVSWLGVQMRYDERIMVENGTTLIQDADESDLRTYGIGGLFGGLDAEWWLTERTGFFGAAYYEQFSRDVQLGAGGREAEVKFSAGLGVRAGLSYRF